MIGCQNTVVDVLSFRMFIVSGFLLIWNQAKMNSKRLVDGFIGSFISDIAVSCADNTLEIAVIVLKTVLFSQEF